MASFSGEHLRPCAKPPNSTPLQSTSNCHLLAKGGMHGTYSQSHEVRLAQLGKALSSILTKSGRKKRSLLPPRAEQASRLVGLPSWSGSWARSSHLMSSNTTKQILMVLERGMNWNTIAQYNSSNDKHPLTSYLCLRVDDLLKWSDILYQFSSEK